MPSKKENVKRNIKHSGYRVERRTELMPIRFSPTELSHVRSIAGEAHDYPSSYLRRLILDSLNFETITLTPQRKEVKAAN